MGDEQANQHPETNATPPWRPPLEDKDTAQAAEEGDRNALQKAKQAIGRLGVPAWALGILVIALTATLVWAGDALIRSRQRLSAPTATMAPARAPTKTSTSTAFAPAEEGQSLILVTDFQDRSGGTYQGLDPAQYIYEQLIAHAQADGHSPLREGQTRVERLRQVVDENTARPAGQAYQAAYVLWGWYDAESIVPSLQRIAATSEHRFTRDDRGLSLSEPDEIAFCAITDLRAQTAYLAQFTLGVIAYSGQESDTGLAYLTGALEAVPPGDECPTDLAYAHFYLGNLHAFDGEYDAALVNYNTALERAPDAAVVYANRGSVHYALDAYQAALADLDRALELDAQDANAYAQRANVHRAMRQTEAALADLDRALELNPQHARAYASRGLVHHNMGAYTDALDDYGRALKLEPDLAEVYLNRGGTYATMGNLDAALDDYGRYLDLNPQDADAHYNRGTVYAMMEKHEQALVDLNRALELRPEFAQVYGNRGLVYKAMGETEKAIADLERFLELSDNPQWCQMIEQQLRELQGE